MSAETPRGVASRPQIGTQKSSAPLDALQGHQLATMFTGGGGDQAGLTLTSLQTGTLKIGSLFDFLPILFIKPPPPPPVLDSQPTSRSASALNSQDGILVQLPPFTSPASPALHQPFSNTVPWWATNGPLVCHRCLGEVILVRPLGDASSQLAAHVPGQRWRS